MECYIKENSAIAKFAAWKLGAARVAIVIGRTVHLHNATRQEFLGNSRWVKHEIAHVRQFRHYGFVVFILMYLWESIRKGYRNNRFEIEARKAEGNKDVDAGIVFL